MISRRLMLVGAICAAAGVLAAIRAHVLRDEAGEVLLYGERRAEAAAVMETGRRLAPLSDGTNLGGINSSQPAPGEQISLNDSGDLIINQSLLKIMNFYLVEQAKAAGLDRLKKDLRSRLSGHALVQAIQIAERYQRYVKEHDLLLSPQNLGESNSNPDISRMRVWVQQRERLRQRTLGSDVAQAWYSNDDVRINQVLQELEQRGNDLAGADGGATPSGGGFDPRSALSEDVKRREALRHAQTIREVLQGTTRSFASLAK